MAVGQNFAVATDKFTVDSSNGNTLIAGTLTGLTSINTGSETGESTISTMTVTDGALAAVTTIGASGTVTLSNDDAAITHSGATGLTVASTLGTVTIESAVFTGSAITGVSEINDGATVDISDVTVNQGAISGVTTINAAAALTLSAAGSTTTVNGALTVTQAATCSSSLSTVGDLSVNTGSDVFKVTAADGNVVCAGTVTAGGSQLTSDARWKTNVVNVTGALDAVLNLRPVYYDWRADSPAGLMHSKNNATAPLPREVGFLAQEVREALPREGEGVVGEVDEAGHLGLSYSKLTAVLVGATQEQQRTIDAQEQTILQLRHEHTAVTEQLTAVTEQLEAERRTNAEQGRELQELRSLVEGLLRAQAGAGRR
jgi:hypothetical protein